MDGVVELRRYTLHPGRRDELIDLFERELVEPQEAAGMRVIGQFRDLDRPDQFVWLRGFDDLAGRAPALSAFYGGPVWRAHGDAANATMIDSDDVLLLRPARPGSGFARATGQRPPPGAAGDAPGLVLAVVLPFAEPVGEGFVEHFADEVEPALAEAGTPVTASFVTETGPNEYPALPVREGEHVFAWFAIYSDERSFEERRGAVRRELDGLARWTSGEPAVARLVPTARSLVRG